MRTWIAALTLVAPWAAGADESRFDPPQRGGYLGVVIEYRDGGMQIDRVVAGAAAERAGLESGDLITRLGDWRFDLEGQSLPDYLGSCESVPTTARVLRDGQRLDIALHPEPLLAATAREISSRIRRHPLFLKLENGGIDTIETDLLDAVNASPSRESAYEAMNATIDRFGLSHSAIITPWVSENLFGDGEHYHLGLFVQRLEAAGGERFFVRSMMFDSPARAAGLRVGDELVAVNGIPFASSPRRTLAGYEARRNIFAIQIDRDETVRLAFRRKRDGALRDVGATADRAIDAVASARTSVRVIGAGGRAPVGYIHFWNVMSADNVGVLRDALGDQFAEVEALAIDLRGRGGKVDVIARLARLIAAETRPVALLIDGEARSAKEMLAYRLKGSPGVTVIGETSAGAVLPATFTALPGGAQLMLPVARGDAVIRAFSGGVRLEGRGVFPEIAVDCPLPYRAGADPILKRALRLLRARTSGKLLKV